MSEQEPGVAKTAAGLEDEPRQDELAAIRQTIARLESAQQSENVEEFMRLFTPHPVWVTGGGKRLIGWDEVHEFTRRVLPGAMRKASARYEVANVSFLRRDVAVVNVDQIPVALDGQILERERQGRPTYVMTKEEGEWLIAAGQNTLVGSAS